MLAKEDFAECHEHAVSVFLFALNVDLKLIKNFKGMPGDILSKLNYWQKPNLALDFGDHVLHRLTLLVGEEDPDALVAKLHIAHANNQILQELGKISWKTYRKVYGDRTDIVVNYQRYTDATVRETHSRRDVVFVLSSLHTFETGLQMFEVFYEERKKLFGANHSSTLRLKQYIANVHRDTCNYAKAMEMYQQILDSTQHITAEDDDYPETLRTTFYIALIHLRLKRYSEAIQMFDDILTKQKQFYGGDHPDTVQTEGNIATALYEVGRQSEALQMFEDIVDKHNKVFGEDHKRTVRYKRATAFVYFDHNKHSEAQRMFEHILVSELKGSGELKDSDELNPDVESTKLCIALTAFNQENYAKALQAFADVLDDAEKANNGRLQELKLMVGHIMVACELNLENYSEAFLIAYELYQRQKSIFGEDHPDTVFTMKVLTMLIEVRAGLALQANLEKARILGPPLQ